MRSALTSKLTESPSNARPVADDQLLKLLAACACAASAVVTERRVCHRPCSGLACSYPKPRAVSKYKDALELATSEWDEIGRT